MATINQGVMGGFSGTVGTVVGGNWNGIDYMRGKRAGLKDTRSIAQMDQRARFTTVMHFLKPLRTFLPVGFKKHKAGMSAYNAATSYHMKHALTGVFPNYSIDYSKVIVSQGALPGALNPVVVPGPARQVEFQWENNSATINAMANDKAVLVIYNPKQKQAIFLTGGQSRISGSQALAIPDHFSGDTLHCYISFQNASQTMISNSRYVGAIGMGR